MRGGEGGTWRARGADLQALVGEIDADLLEAVTVEILEPKDVKQSNVPAHNDGTVVRAGWLADAVREARGVWGSNVFPVDIGPGSSRTHRSSMSGGMPSARHSLRRVTTCEKSEE